MNRNTNLATRWVAGSFLCAAFSGCAFDSVSTQVPASQEQAFNPSRPDAEDPKTVERDEAEEAFLEAGPVDVTPFQEGYRFIPYVESREDTQFVFPVSYEASSRYNVNWYAGGEAGVPGVELIVVDPVNKTLSLAFPSKSAQVCPSDSLEQNLAQGKERGAVLGGSYSACTSRFSRFLEKASAAGPQSETSRQFWVKTDPQKVALVARQLNLYQRADERLTGGDLIRPAESKQALLGRLRVVTRNYESKLRDLQREFIDTYQKRADETPAISRSVKDRSGYFNYDVKWEDAVFLRPRDIKVKTFNYAQFLEPLEQESQSDALKPMVSILLARIKQQYEQDRAVLLRTLRELTARYEVVCGHPDFLGSYQIRVSCPDVVEADLVDSIGVEVKYEVLGRRFGFVTPKYVAHNQDLGLSMDGNTMVLSSSSSRPIRVDEVQVIINDQLATLYRSESLSVGRLLKARSSLPFSLQSALPDEMVKALSISYTSNRKAVRTKMHFGFIVRYRFEGEESSLALEEVKNYSLNDVLIGQL